MSFLLCFELEMPLEGSLVKATGNSGFQLESESSHLHFKTSTLKTVLQHLKLKVIHIVCMKDW